MRVYENLDLLFETNKNDAGIAIRGIKNENVIYRNWYKKTTVACLGGGSYLSLKRLLLKSKRL